MVKIDIWMWYGLVIRASDCLLLNKYAANVKVATVLGSIPESSDTVESEGQQMKQCGMKYIKKI